MSTPPPPPPGDATPPPAGDTPPAAAAPTTPATSPHPQFAAPVAAKSGGAKKIIFILIGVLALGGMGFAGYKYGPDLWAKYFGGGDINTPDGAIKRVFNGLADNKPEVLWEALPVKHQKLITDEIKKSSANVDAEVQTKIVDVLKKLVGILKNKKTIILETAQMMGGQGGGQGDVLPAEVTENWDGIVSLLEIVVNSKAMTPDWLKNPNVGAVLKEDGGKLMSSPVLEIFVNKTLAESNEADSPKNLAEVRSWLKGITVTVISSTETTAKVKIGSTDFTIPDDESELDMVKVEGRWLPKAMADGLEQMIAMLKQTVPMGQQLGSAPMTQQQKTILLTFLNSLDRVLDQLNQANTAQEFQTAAMMAAGNIGAQFMGLQQALGGGGMGGGFPGTQPGINPGINPNTGFPNTPGTQPGVQPGTNPGINLPGISPRGPAGYNITWTAGLGNKNRIDLIYPGQPEGNVEKAFGPCQEKNGQLWTYRGLKIRNLRQGGTFTTAIFQMQNGKVASVIIQP